MNIKKKPVFWFLVLTVGMILTSWNLPRWSSWGLDWYIVAWIIIPQKPLEGVGEIDTSASQGEISQPVVDTQIDEEEKTDKTKLIAGVVLIALGAFFLLNTLNIFVWFSFFKLWPVVLIVIGAVILLKGLNRGEHDES